MPVVLQAPSSAGQSPEDRSRDQLITFYRILGNVIGELRSQEIRDTYAAITLDEVIQQQLAFLVDGTPTRISRKQHLQQMYDEFKANLQAIKDTPPSAFRQTDEKDDVNTPP
jgi:hypothetical protein